MPFFSLARRKPPFRTPGPPRSVPKRAPSGSGGPETLLGASQTGINAASFPLQNKGKVPRAVDPGARFPWSTHTAKSDPK